MTDISEDLAVVAHIHEEDCVVLPGVDAHAMASKLRELMWYYSYNKQGSDYVCCFCGNRGHGNGDTIDHEADCDGRKFLKLLGEPI